MDNLICINSHCNTYFFISITVTINNYLKNNGKDILLISHIPLDKDVIDLIDHFIYDKINPILHYPEKYNVVWTNIDDYRLISYTLI